ncbi:DUF2752 domain-containing protein [Demequina muriae]|uniref:DUF2752 domain-containing protein n=1 Tax=Demequina muriae TaxID=3051664 RepID=A0ABT8GD17_9MICO|nr:DUF2752 domain-containing protein [Demequina sp. EGI L300058]MDN4479332.1 DUF2752 domain-containing protein [Demequina sp. EGI L300058]
MQSRTAEALAAPATDSPVRRLAAPVSALAVLALATAYTALADPYRAGFFPPCIFLSASGHWCPGCGGLRAVHELAHGDVGAALAMNPVVVLLIVPLGVVLALAWVRNAWRGQPPPAIPMWLAISLPAVLLVFWVVRNIPVLEPYLAP